MVYQRIAATLAPTFAKSVNSPRIGIEAVAEIIDVFGFVAAGDGVSLHHDEVGK